MRLSSQKRYSSFHYGTPPAASCGRRQRLGQKGAHFRPNLPSPRPKVAGDGAIMRIAGFLAWSFPEAPLWRRPPRRFEEHEDSRNRTRGMTETVEFIELRALRVLRGENSRPLQEKTMGFLAGERIWTFYPVSGMFKVNKKRKRYATAQNASIRKRPGRQTSEVAR